MDYQKLQILIACLTATIFIFIFRLLNQTKNSKKLPPGPKPFPIIGNILELGKNPHKSLAKLSKIYGPIMTLKLGNKTTIVISSPQLAKQVIIENSQIFSSRTIPHAVCVLDHHKFALGFLPYNSPRWRKFRRICATKVFSPKMLDLTKDIRHQKLQELLNYLNEKCDKHEIIDIGEVVFTTILNSISNTLFSMDLAHSKPDEESQEFEKSIRGLSEESGRPNIADFFPVLRVLDPQSVYARMAEHWKKVCEIIGGIIEERTYSRISRADSKVFNDVLDSILDNIGDTDSQLSRDEIFHLFLDLFIGGIDTTSSTIEWIMAELMRNPDKLTKAKQELHQEIGKDGKIEESNISKLPFLQAIVKEAFRLHPPAPFLVPRKCDETVNINDFIVPKNAQVLINVWAMGRNSTIWENPNIFMPERFLDCDINYRGNNFELIPFGAGPRICPGLPLAQKTMPLIVANLIHNFDWKLVDGLMPEEINMEEKFGLTLIMDQPLRVQPISVNQG